MTASSSHDHRRRERIAENLYQRVSAGGVTHYEVKFRDADGAFRSLTLKHVRTETEAKVAARRILGKRDGGDRVVAVNVTISNAAEEWFSVLDGTAAAGERSERGVQEYRDRWRLHIDPRIGRRKLAQIAPEHIAALVTDMRDKGYAANTIRGTLTILGSFFAHARSRGWTSVNPLDGLDPNTDIPAAKPRKEGRVLDERELRRLCDNTLVGYANVVTVLAYTGLRISEALGLVWGDVDFVDGEIEITQQLSRGTINVPARRVRLKTDNSKRRVPMMPIVMDSLTDLLTSATAAGRNGESDLVFVTLTGRPMSQRNVSARGVGKAATRAGLGKVSPHDLRRSFCSLAGRRGIDPIIAANITGHSLATWQSAYAKDFGKDHRDEARATLLAAGFGRSADTLLTPGP